MSFLFFPPPYKNYSLTGSFTSDWKLLTRKVKLYIPSYSYQVFSENKMSSRHSGDGILRVKTTLVTKPSVTHSVWSTSFQGFPVPPDSVSGTRWFRDSSVRGFVLSSPLWVVRSQGSRDPVMGDTTQDSTQTRGWRRGPFVTGSHQSVGRSLVASWR